MTATSTHATSETRIEADPALPIIRITRDFEAPVARVFRAWTEPELVEQWMGPKDTPTKVSHWDMRRGGSYRFASWRDGQEIATFYGSFHDVRPNERIVQTFTWEGEPDGVALETLTFTDLGGGRTRTEIGSLVESLQTRDMILASGMETGVVDGYETLDALLARGE